MPDSMGTNTSGFYLDHTTDASGDYKVLLKTENKFVDKDIAITITTSAATAPTLAAADINTALAMGAASNGVYAPTVTITGNANIATAGWITAGNHGVSDTEVKIGTINQSTLANGNTTITSGTTITPGESSQTITISEGYNTARTVIFGAASSGTPGEVTSGTATIDALSYAYNTTNSNFQITGSATVSAPTVDGAGYISNTIGTKNSKANGAIVAATVDTVKVGVTVSGTAKVTPTIARTTKPSGDTWVDAASGAATGTKPTSGAYVQVDAAAASETLTITGKVSGAGYGTTDHYTTDTATSTSVGSNAAATKYIPIKAGTITSGTATISSATYTYNSTNSNFTVSGSANVSVPTYTEGYISSSVGTKNANSDGATLSTTVAKIGIAASLSGTGTYAPSITKNPATNINGAGAATTTQPSSGHYVAVASAANTSTVQATAAVTSAGYGTTTSGQYTTTPSSALTVGAAASSVTYIPLTTATFANAGTASVTYTDISSTAPVLISGDYLYINEGYTSNCKISLARLVPDASGTNAPAEYILNGYTAFNNDGTLIIGSMQTYTGIYEVV